MIPLDAHVSNQIVKILNKKMENISFNDTFLKKNFHTLNWHPVFASHLEDMKWHHKIYSPVKKLALIPLLGFYYKWTERQSVEHLSLSATEQCDGLGSVWEHLGVENLFMKLHCGQVETQQTLTWYYHSLEELYLVWGRSIKQGV